MGHDSDKSAPAPSTKPSPSEPGRVPQDVTPAGRQHSTIIWPLATAGGSDQAGSGAARTQPNSLDAPQVEIATIGKYQVVGALDSGGQGDVYRAVHPQLQKELVIKLGRRPLSAERGEQDRLIAEGRVLAELDHPHLARVYDLDCHKGRPFLVMEYIRGRNLRQYARGGSLLWRESARLIGQVARGLAVAHARGVLHLDVKPENVIVDDRGSARLIDFGMARLRHAWTDDAPAPGSVSGTIPFMAPEQARGETDQLDQRTDVFALGAVLYWLLTGKPPFGTLQAPNALVAAQGCTFDRDALERADAPRPLIDACLKAMSAEQSRRFASAEEFANTIEPIAAPSSGKKSLASVSVGNLGCAVTITACAIFLVVGFAVQQTWEQRRRDEQLAMATPEPARQEVTPKLGDPVPPPPGTRLLPPSPVDQALPAPAEALTPGAGIDDPPEFGFLNVDIKQPKAEESTSLYTFDKRIHAGEEQLICTIELPENVVPAIFHVRYAKDDPNPRVERHEMKIDERFDQSKVKYNRWKWENSVTISGTAPDAPASPATHLYVVCASDATAPTLETLQQLIEQDADASPLGDWVIRFDPRKAEFWGIAMQRAQDAPGGISQELEALRARLDKFSKRLAARYKYVSGVAFPAD